MLDRLKKYLSVRAEAKKKMEMGDLEGYMTNLLELYRIRMSISTPDASA